MHYLPFRRSYNEQMAGFSIPASEHSVICMWGKENEEHAFRNMLTKFAKKGAIAACVSDTYDIYNAVDNLWGNNLKDEVINSGATLVVRPDSGDPTRVPIDIIEKLSIKFGYTINDKGYKVLPQCVRVIQGDGIDVDILPEILHNLLYRGFSAENLSFGQGGGLLQKVNRDTFMFAQKASAGYVNGEWRDIFKNPVTDINKKSKKGRFILTRERGKWETLNINTGFDWANTLRTVYLDGKLVVDDNFAKIRERANQLPLN